MIATEGDKRVITLSSSTVSSGVWDPNNLQGENSYDNLKFYGNSKLYTVGIENRSIVICCINLFTIDHDGIFPAKESTG